VLGLALQLDLAQPRHVADPDRRTARLALALDRPVLDRHLPSVPLVDPAPGPARLREQDACGYGLESQVGRRAVGFEELVAHDRSLSPSGS
jgi:hypothetical protein